MNNTGKMFALAGFAMAMFSTSVTADMVTIDLTHPIPTFAPSAEDPMKADLTKPYLDSKPVPTFGGQTVFALGEFPTSQGKFDLGTLVLAEHHGTHLDTPGHYINDASSMEDGGIAPSDRKLAHQLGASDLIGPVVLIDISARVDTELAKNGGVPSADTNVTDFSNDSGNVVTPDDINAIADKINDGAWLVLNTGWSKFFFSGTDFTADPYTTGSIIPASTRPRSIA